MALENSAAARLQRARISLDGLSVGDAFGTALGEFRTSASQVRWLRERIDPTYPQWGTTDDTEMGIAVVETLEVSQAVDSDALAKRFAARYKREPNRGYGGGASKLLYAYAEGKNWREQARGSFGGQGSMGNGAAMRAMPVGAYFADLEDLDSIVEGATNSALPTHSHAQGIAGAVAAALAAAWAARRAAKYQDGSLFDFVLRTLPEGEVRQGVERAKALNASIEVGSAVASLGNGQAVIAADTVPFCLWVAARHADDFSKALWAAADAGGDRDTLCAIVGGIVALSAGSRSIPPNWLRKREPLQPTGEF